MQGSKVLSRLLLFLLACSSLGFNNCNTIDYTVVIEYEEAAVCGLFQEQSGTTPQQTTAAGQGLFVVYKIISIKNTASGAKDFSFDPNKFYVNSSPRGTMAGGILSPHQTASARVIPKGTTAPNLGRVIINVPGNAQDITSSDNHLLYESGTGESVLFDRKSRVKQVLSPCTPSNLP